MKVLIFFTILKSYLYLNSYCKKKQTWFSCNSNCKSDEESLGIHLQNLCNIIWKVLRLQPIK